MWCALAFHPNQIKQCADGRSRLMVSPMHIRETQIESARSQGWIMIGIDSEVMLEPMDVPAQPAQSNPRRHTDVYRDFGEQ